MCGDRVRIPQYPGERDPAGTHQIRSLAQALLPRLSPKLFRTLEHRLLWVSGSGIIPVAEAHIDAEARNMANESSFDNPSDRDLAEAIAASKAEVAAILAENGGAFGGYVSRVCCRIHTLQRLRSSSRIPR